MSTSAGYYLSLLQRHGYLHGQQLRYAISPDDVIHLDPDVCWPAGANADAVRQGDIEPLRRLRRRFCECSHDLTLPDLGHRSNPAVAAQLTWLSETASFWSFTDHVRIGLEQLTEVLYAWMTRPPASDNASVNGHVDEVADQLWTQREGLLSSTAYTEEYALALRQGLAEYDELRDIAESGPAHAVHRVHEYGYAEPVPIPADRNDAPAADIIDRYQSPQLWALFNDLDVMVSRALIACKPDVDGYRVHGKDVLVKVPAVIAIGCSITVGSVLGIDDGYTIDEVAAVQPLVEGGTITLADAVGALRSART